MRRLFRVGFFFIKLVVAYIVAYVIKLFVKKMRNIWIISERGNDARDNGWFFFKYMIEKHPEQSIYFIISSDSPDVAKVRKIGKTIETNSFKHFVYYALSTVRISAHMWGGDLPYSAYFYNIRKYMLRSRKFVFLQHGITKDYLPHICASSGNPDIFICGGEPEYNYVRDNFGHPKENVKYTGFSRFDNLHGIHTKNQILVMPTFRRWLQDVEDCEVTTSEYVAEWNRVLNDSRITSLLEEKNMDLVFYPHYVMQRHIMNFQTESPRIKIASIKDYDVQQLLIDSKLLVTDYSSVFFDFAYMEKPIVYYQFDRERYIQDHYDFTKGYFSYENNGFGDVAYNHDCLIDAITKLFDMDFEMEDKYKARLEAFFKIRDQRNSERIYEAIIQKTK